MNKISSREFTEEDYLAMAGAIECEGHKPRIVEFEDGADEVDVVLAYTVEGEVSLEIDLYQGDSAVSYGMSTETYQKGEELFRKLEDELELLCFGEFIDSLSQYSFKHMF